MDLTAALPSSTVIDIHSKKIWRIEDVVEFLGVSKGYIYQLTSKEKIPFIKKGKLVYFVPQEIENWVLEGNIHEQSRH